MIFKIDRTTIDDEIGMAFVDGKEIQLSRMWLLLLRYFHEHRGEVMFRKDLEDKFFLGIRTSNSLAVHISRMKSALKIGSNALANVHSVGYILYRPEDRSEEQHDQI